MIRAVFLSVSLLAAAPAWAQSGQDQMMQAGQSLETSMDAARLAAARPDDEQMTCEAIQAEMTTTMSDPAMQSQMAALGQWAQTQQGQAEEQRRAAAGMATASIVGGIVSSFVPFAGYAQGLAMQAQMQGMQTQADQSNRESAVMMGGMETTMPQMMRGERLYALAEAQQCAFLNEQGMPAQ